MSNRTHDDNIHRSFLSYIKTETSALSETEHKMSNKSQGDNMNRSYSRNTHQLGFISDVSFGWTTHAKSNPTCSGDLNMNQSFPFTHSFVKMEAW